MGDKPLQNHEYYHTYQYQAWGIIYGDIYVMWALLLRTTGRQHPLERPAYRIQDLYTRNRDWLPDLWEFPWVALANQRGGR